MIKIVTARGHVVGFSADIQALFFIAIPLFSRSTIAYGVGL